MSEAARRPVLVGVGQVLQRSGDLGAAREPLELMVEAAERAAADAGARALLEGVGSVRVVRGMWRYADPGRVVAERVGCPGAKTALSQYGGNYAQTLTSLSCAEIQSGALESVLIVGAECGRSWARAKKAGVELGWSDAPGTPDREIGAPLRMSHEAELARGIRMPIQVYPVFEIALRAARGEAVDAHLKRISELWAGFSAVAADNPHAWLREPRSAEEIRRVGPDNPAVSFPYPMLMNSNSRVDMGAALLLTSEARAKALGVPREQWIYPHVATEADDCAFLSGRDSLSASPAIRIAGGRCLELAGVEPGDLAHRDLYSCFPSAVQVSARELGLDESRPLTVTGGLTFGGGPMNDYTTHAIARMAEVLRADPGAKGLVTGNGGFLTKHAFCVYSSEPPEGPFVHEDLQAEVDALPTREAVVEHEGEVTLEAYSVMYADGAPDLGHVACLLPDGRRSWGNVRDPSVLEAMTREEFCGRAGRLALDGTLAVLA